MSKLSWEGFRARVAGTAGVPVERIAPNTRLLGDLGLDSLALSELVVLLVMELRMASLEAEVGTREWRHVTVGELFEEYGREKAPQPRAQFVMRTRPH